MISFIIENLTKRMRNCCSKYAHKTNIILAFYRETPYEITFNLTLVILEKENVDCVNTHTFLN